MLKVRFPVAAAAAVIAKWPTVGGTAGHWRVTRGCRLRLRQPAHAGQTVTKRRVAVVARAQCSRVQSLDKVYS